VKQRGAQESSSQEDALLGARIRGVGMQTAGQLDEVKSLAGPASEKPPAPRRIDQIYLPHNAHSPTADQRSLPNRFLRRRYRELLGRIPVLTYSYVPGESVTSSNGHPTGKYEVSLARTAISQYVKPVTHSEELDAVDLAWIERENGSLSAH